MEWSYGNPVVVVVVAVSCHLSGAMELTSTQMKNKQEVCTEAMAENQDPLCFDF